MYDTTNDGTAGYLVENPIKRYLVNSTTPGLVYGENSSLTMSCASTCPNRLPWMAVGRRHRLNAWDGPQVLQLKEK
jgi:hypothetical protein